LVVKKPLISLSLWVLRSWSSQEATETSSFLGWMDFIKALILSSSFEEVEEVGLVIISIRNSDFRKIIFEGNEFLIFYEKRSTKIIHNSLLSLYYGDYLGISLSLDTHYQVMVS
jgi:hypothetical protein